MSDSSASPPEPNSNGMAFILFGEKLHTIASSEFVSVTITAVILGVIGLMIPIFSAPSMAVAGFTSGVLTKMGFPMGFKFFAVTLLGMFAIEFLTAFLKTLLL